MMPLNNPTNHGWREEEGTLLPIWTSLPLARDLLHLDVKCTCTSTCSLSLQVHEGKIEMHTSLQVYMCEVAGQEQYAIRNYMYVQFVIAYDTFFSFLDMRQ